MKTTNYFNYVRQRPDRAIIHDRWIQDVIARPVKTAVQPDGRIRKWGFVVEMNKYLRVILLEDGQTVHNAFFDRTFRG